MRVLYLLSVWLHILAAAVWIGGMLFLVLVLVPLARAREFRREAPRLVQLIGRRFRTVGWACLGLLVATGLVNASYRFGGLPALATGAFWRSATGRIFAVKLLCVVAILTLSAVHDFRVGPRASAALLEAPGSPRALALRRRATWFGRVNVALALLVVALAVMLVRGLP